MNSTYRLKNASVIGSILAALLIVASPVHAQTDQYAAYNKIKGQLREMKAQDAKAYSVAQAFVNKLTLPPSLKGIPQGTPAEEVHAVAFFDIFKQKFKTEDERIKTEDGNAQIAARYAAEEALREAQRKRNSEYPDYEFSLKSYKSQDPDAYNKAIKAVGNRTIEGSLASKRYADIPLADRNDPVKVNPYVFQEDFNKAWSAAHNANTAAAHAAQQSAYSQQAQQAAAARATSEAAAEAQIAAGAAQQARWDAEAAKAKRDVDAAKLQAAIDAANRASQRILDGGDLSDIVGLQQGVGVIAHNVSGVIANHDSGFSTAAVKVPTIQQALAVLDRAVKSNDRKAVLAALDTLKWSLQAAKDALRQSR